MRNRGELAEGWYDPSTFQKAQQSASSSAPDHDDGSSNTRPRATSPSSTSARDPAANEEAGEEDSDTDSDDSVGPTLPGQERRSRGSRRMGPRIPGMQDLELKRGKGFFCDRG